MSHPLVKTCSNTGCKIGKSLFTYLLLRKAKLLLRHLIGKILRLMLWQQNLHIALGVLLGIGLKSIH